jgi:Bacteriophage protein gp37
MTRTSIEWVRNQDGTQGFTVNPIRFRNKKTGKVGHYCEKLSPGCKHCYASRMQTGPYLSGLEFTAENKDRGELFFEDEVIQQVLWRRKPATFFWCDCTDLFGPWVKDSWIDRIVGCCALTPQHRHLWLTKRADRMREYCHTSKQIKYGKYLDIGTCKAYDWPLPNLGLGVSAEDQERANKRIENLRQTPAAMRFLSAEPLLSALDVSPWLTRWTGQGSGLPKPLSTALATLPDIHGLDWVITGGETGPGASPMPPEWPRAIRDQCQAAGVPYFHKHNGEWSVSNNGRDLFKVGQCDDVPIGDGLHHRMFRVGKKAAGRLLDGRTWDELPEMLR